MTHDPSSTTGKPAGLAPAGFVSPASVRGWRIDVVDGLPLLRCAALDRVPGFTHAFSLARDANGANFDAGSADEADADGRASRARFGRALGLDAPIDVLHQVHGPELIEAPPVGSTRSAPEADGWLSRRGDAPVGIRTADCIPLILAEREGAHAAAIHAGWRGVAAGIGPRAVEALSGLGAPPGRLQAVLGPAISGPRYEVGEEVVEALAATLPAHESSTGLVRDDAGRARVDVRQVLARQLVAAGIPEEAISVSPHCTWDGPGEFHSFRRDRERAGRSLVVIGWK